jgi:hypothetical protein
MKELHLKLGIGQVNLILEALGTQPYLRVYELIEQIQMQAKEQMNGAGPKLAMPGDAGQTELKPVVENHVN